MLGGSRSDLYRALSILEPAVGNVRIGVVVVIVVIFLLAFSEFRAVLRELIQIVISILKGSRLEKTLASFIGLVVLIEGLAAMAPLTGSDALHYHFRRRCSF